MNLKIALIANCPVSHKSMGGGDRTLIELAKIWQAWGADLTIFGPPESRSVCQIGGLDAKFVETSKYEAGTLGTKRAYFFRIFSALASRQKFGSFDVIYAASEALPDVALSLKIKNQNPGSKWVVGFFLRARNPFFGEVPFAPSNILQLVQQQLSLVLMKLFGATAVFVAGKPDESYAKAWGFKNVLKIGGGVNLDFVNSISAQEKVYDACFVGRISPQKGVSDLLRVWEKVTKTRPEAKLIFIGWGHKGEAENYQKKIMELGLSKNIEFVGFCDGAEKYKRVKASKLSLFPSKYESFGIVLLESLACGTPVVAYDLPVLKDNFNRGVAYVPLGDAEAMGGQILVLLNNPAVLQKLSIEGLEVSGHFGWSEIGSRTYQFIQSLIQS